MPRQVMIPPTSLTAEQLASRLLCPGVMMNGDKPFTLRKAAFLKGLRSSGSLEYKRYLASPLHYAGGKSLAVGMITALLPDNVRRLASPFIGGGSVEIACANELGLDVCAYDVFDVLCSYWRVQIRTPQALASRLRKFDPNRATFSAVKKRLEGHWKNGNRLGHYDLAAHYYFNSNTSYGPHFLGWPSDVYLAEGRYTKMVGKVEAFRTPRLRVECASFDESIPKHSGDFLYCDPPYYLEEGKTFVGMYPHRNFPIHHKGFEHKKLRDLLRKHRGGFILSYNDCPNNQRVV